MQLAGTWLRQIPGAGRLQWRGAEEARAATSASPKRKEEGQPAKRGASLRSRARSQLRRGDEELEGTKKGEQSDSTTANEDELEKIRNELIIARDRVLILEEGVGKSEKLALRAQQSLENSRVKLQGAYQEQKDLETRFLDLWRVRETGGTQEKRRFPSMCATGSWAI